MIPRLLVWCGGVEETDSQAVSTMPEKICQAASGLPGSVTPKELPGKLICVEELIVCICITTHTHIHTHIVSWLIELKHRATKR